MEEAKRDDEDKPLHYLLPLTNDMLNLRDKISHTLQWEDIGKGFRKSSLFKDYLGQKEHTGRGEKPDPGNLEVGERQLRFNGFEYPVGLDLKQTLEVLFIGLFRSNIYISPNSTENIEYTGWFVDPVDLWDDKKQVTLERLQEYFNDVEKDPKKFIRTTAPFSEDLFEIGYKRKPPNPEILYTRELDKHCKGLPYLIQKFERVAENQTGDYVLEPTEDDRDKIIPIEQSSRADAKQYNLIGESEVTPN